MKTMQFLPLLLCAALALPAHAWVNKAEAAQVRKYCAEYARAVADAGLKNPAQEIATRFKKSNIFLRAINKAAQSIFQPRAYRFATGYECDFYNRDKSFDAEVTLLLTHNKEYADYMRWDRIMFLDFGRVLDEEGLVKYYILPKYLKVNGGIFSVTDEKQF